MLGLNGVRFRLFSLNWLVMVSGRAENDSLAEDKGLIMQAVVIMLLTNLTLSFTVPGAPSLEARRSGGAAARLSRGTYHRR
jgi:hypothetical protein